LSAPNLAASHQAAEGAKKLEEAWRFLYLVIGVR